MNFSNKKTEDLISIDFCCFNARGLNGKKHELCYEVECNDRYIFVITETFFGEQFKNSFLTTILDTHFFVRTDRSPLVGLGGGVLMLIPRFLEVFSYDSISNDYFELANATVGFKGRKLFRIVGIYRSPTPNKIASVNALTNFIDDLHVSTLPTILLGDFNLPDIRWSGALPMSQCEFEFVASVLSKGFSQLVLESTHDSGNTLDLVFSSDLNILSAVNVGTNFSTSDHAKIEGKIGPFARNESNQIMFYNFEKARIDDIVEYLEACDFDFIAMNQLGIDQQWQQLREKLISAIRSFVPFCKFTARKHVWSRETSNLHKKQEKLHSKWKRTRNPSDKDAWLNCARHTRRMKRQDACAYEKRIIDSENDKRFWSFVRSRNIPRSEIPFVCVDGCDVFDGRDKAQAFNDYFSSVFVNDDGTLPFLARVPTSLEHCVFSPELVSNALSDLVPKLSMGPDGIPPWFLHTFRLILGVPLSNLFNNVMVSGVIPSEWKLARVVPIHKKGSKRDVRNYRPISMLCSCSRVMEGIVDKLLYTYLSDHHYISPSQHGFRSGRSTVSQLLETLDDWTKALDEGKKLDALYIDISKAFDTVSHPKLLHKLNQMGITGNLLRFFSCYLHGRHQFVDIDGCRSDLSVVGSGVPQGSSLGPRLFLLYMNDITTVLNDVVCKMYADDAKLYYTFTNNDDVEPRRIEINGIIRWANDNQLNIAFEKCNVLHFGCGNPCLEFLLGDKTIIAVNKIRDLGVQISNTLKPSEHCWEIASVCFRMINIIFASFTIRDPWFLRKLFVVFVRTKLEYACEVWSPVLVRDIDILERVQRSFTKRIPGFYNLAYDDRLLRLELESLELRRQRQDLVMLYKIANHIIDIEFDSMFEWATGLQTRGHSLRIQIPRCRLNIRKSFFACRVVPFWNALPDYLVNATSVVVFKRKIQQFTFEVRPGGRVYAVDSAQPDPR